MILNTPHYGTLKECAPIGKDLEKIMLLAGLDIVSVYPFLIKFNSPILGAPRTYLEALHQSWYVEDTQGILSTEDNANWSNAFDSRKPNNVFDNPNTKYEEVEFLVIGRKNK